MVQEIYAGGGPWGWRKLIFISMGFLVGNVHLTSRSLQTWKTFEIFPSSAAFPHVEIHSVIQIQKTNSVIENIQRIGWFVVFLRYIEFGVPMVPFSLNVV